MTDDVNRTPDEALPPEETAAPPEATADTTPPPAAAPEMTPPESRPAAAAPAHGEADEASADDTSADDDESRMSERLERLGGEPAPAISPEEFARLQQSGQIHIDSRGRVRTSRRENTDAGMSLRKRRAWYS